MRLEIISLNYTFMFLHNTEIVRIYCVKSRTDMVYEHLKTRATPLSYLTVMYVIGIQTKMLQIAIHVVLIAYIVFTQC